MRFKNNLSIPKKLPLLVTDEILLPNHMMKMTLTCGRDISLIRSLLSFPRTDDLLMIGLISTKENSDLHDIGTIGIIIKNIDPTYGRPYYELFVKGLCRFKLISLVQEHPYLIATVKQLDRFPEEIGTELKETDEFLVAFRKLAEELLLLLKLPLSNQKLKEFMTFLPTDYLLDVVAAITKLSNMEKFKILTTVDKHERAKLIMPSLTEFIKALQPQMKKYGDKEERRIVRIYPGGRMPRFGMGDDDDNDFGDLEAKINEAKVPPEAMKVISKELKRLQRINSNSPEYSMLRNYLELVSDLPWSNMAEETVCCISKARHDLDNDHYGMEKVKKRVLEYLAVRQLRGDLKGPILCLTGPPGVGKTSIARSIASTLRRPFHRISLGGVSDQHDIRGHRRTYIGAMPGRIIQGLRTVKVKNPVFLLDEVDKLSRGWQGDPAAALLEVLDPEQNFAFVDTYLNVPFDLSQVLFVATANNLQTVPSPLLDRMEIINVPGYTQEEKVKIAEYHLVRKEISEHGLDHDAVIFPEAILKSIIGEYTREAGVRSLQRKVGALCRAVAVKFAEYAQSEETESESQDSNNSVNLEEPGKAVSSTQVVEIDSQMLHEILGPPVFQSGLTGRVCVPGVAIGLAWTPSGGDVLVVEASLTEGESGLILTGQLGKVMQESAKIALSWVRQHAEEFGLEKDFMKCGEIHVHFPAGAIAKDGPSAGVTMITVLVSLLSGKCVRPELAMTGEITLNGVVLPVGGIKEKILAAHRSGLTKVVLPAANKKDLTEVPKSVLDKLEVILVNTVDEVLIAAFEEPPYGPLPKDHMLSKL